MYFSSSILCITLKLPLFLQPEMPNVMTVSVSHIRHALQESYSAQEAANLSRIVCCEMLGQTAVDYYLGKDMILSPKEMQDLDTILARLRNFEPIQYVQGTARFLERSYHVAPGVLIPRPETEELVEVMLKEVPSGARILDIGTGSGCIAISLSKMLPDAKVTAWDISDTALRIARRNNEALQASVAFRYAPNRLGFQTIMTPPDGSGTLPTARILAPIRFRLR
jgi:release factor glutamine methyltransferase